MDYVNAIDWRTLGGAVAYDKGLELLHQVRESNEESTDIEPEHSYHKDYREVGVKGSAEYKHRIKTDKYRLYTPEIYKENEKLDPSSDTVRNMEKYARMIEASYQEEDHHTYNEANLQSYLGDDFYKVPELSDADSVVFRNDKEKRNYIAVRGTKGSSVRDWLNNALIIAGLTSPEHHKLYNSLSSSVLSGDLIEALVGLDKLPLGNIISTLVDRLTPADLYYYKKAFGGVLPKILEKHLPDKYKEILESVKTSTIENPFNLEKDYGTYTTNNEGKEVFKHIPRPPDVDMELMKNRPPTDEEKKVASAREFGHELGRHNIDTLRNIFGGNIHRRGANRWEGWSEEPLTDRDMGHIIRPSQSRGQTEAHNWVDKTPFSQYAYRLSDLGSDDDPDDYPMYDTHNLDEQLRERTYDRMGGGTLGGRWFQRRQRSEEDARLHHLQPNDPLYFTPSGHKLTTRGYILGQNPNNWGINPFWSQIYSEKPYTDEESAPAMMDRPFHIDETTDTVYYRNRLVPESEHITSEVVKKQKIREDVVPKILGFKARMQQLRDKYDKVSKNGWETHVAGHSLGGLYSENLATEKGIEGHLFNTGSALPDRLLGAMYKIFPSTQPKTKTKNTYYTTTSKNDWSDLVGYGASNKMGTHINVHTDEDFPGLSGIHGIKWFRDIADNIRNKNIKVHVKDEREQKKNYPGRRDAGRYKQRRSEVKCRSGYEWDSVKNVCRKVGS